MRGAHLVLADERLAVPEGKGGRNEDEEEEREALARARVDHAAWRSARDPNATRGLHSPDRGKGEGQQRRKLLDEEVVVGGEAKRRRRGPLRDRLQVERKGNWACFFGRKNITISRFWATTWGTAQVARGPNPPLVTNPCMYKVCLSTKIEVHKIAFFFFPSTL